MALSTGLIALLLLHPGLPYQDASKPAVERARDLVSRMTVDEKIAQCMMEAPAIPRLDVPAYHYWSEALHGIANDGYATVFPQAIGLAATWDPEWMQRVSTVISTEARAKYQEALRHDQHAIFKGITLWSPNVNMFRDPRWGRGQETYGEDPFLTGRMGTAFVKGIQGDDPTYLRAVATPKHFAVHSGPEPLRHGFDAHVTDRELHEYYLPAFEACVRDGHAASLMSAYSGFNGIPCTGNATLLTDILRKDWGFDGAVVSDVDSVGDIFYGHHATKTLAEAAAMALKAGDDECSGTSYQALREALDRHLIEESDLDRAAVRLFTLRFRLGMFDSPEQCAYQRISLAENDTPAHERLALETAKKSLVLLKNDGVLPLRTRQLHRVAIIGPVATSQRVLVGNYNGVPARPVTLLAGIQGALEAQGVHVDYLAGSSLVTRSGATYTPFPANCLFTDATRTTPGLHGEVFNGLKFEGPAIATRTDKRVDFAWGDGDSVEGIPGQHVSIRWTGVFVAPSTQDGSFVASVDDGVRLWIDDRQVLDEWRDEPETAFSAPFHLKAGQVYKIRLEFYQNEGGAAIRFGWSPKTTTRETYSEAATLARSSDLTILTLGITPDLEGEEMSVNAEGFKGGDRTAIELPKPQRDLLNAVAATGKPVVVVLTSGSALALDTSKANAILLQWYSGEMGGRAVAEALLGNAHLGGRLPVTFYRSTADLPSFTDYHLSGRTYRYFKGRPLYPFGYGLSYTKFQYGRPSFPTRQIATSGAIAFTAPVRNVGKVVGDEVVQVYARPARPNPGDPKRFLVGFQRLSLSPGEARQIAFSIPVARLRQWDAHVNRFVVKSGSYVVEVGASSSDIKATEKVMVQGGSL